MSLPSCSPPLLSSATILDLEAQFNNTIVLEWSASSAATMHAWQPSTTWFVTAALALVICWLLRGKSEPAQLKPHVKARAKHPAYPTRASVPDVFVPWSKSWPVYEPMEFTHDAVFANDCTVRQGGWADPIDPASSCIDWANRKSFSGSLAFESISSAPLNPYGRTGMKGRGLLGKWGPNHAADPIVTRFDPLSNKLQVVVIQRRDCNEWALPGGMVDAGENVSVTVRREFVEEAGNVAEEERERFETQVAELFASGSMVYRGYVDDPRNTDNSWMETTAFHFHCDRALGSKIALAAGDDAATVKWLNVDDTAHLYASHRDWVEVVARNMSERCRE